MPIPDYRNFQRLTELYHYGMPRRSGRYPWGSGDRPYQSRELNYNLNKLNKVNKRLQYSNLRADSIESYKVAHPFLSSTVLKPGLWLNEKLNQNAIRKYKSIAQKYLDYFYGFEDYQGGTEDEKPEVTLEIDQRSPKSYNWEFYLKNNR